MRFNRATFIVTVIVLTACSPQLDLTENARQALEQRLLALPGGDAEFTIGQAWPGVRPQSEPGSYMEIWCVEVDHSLVNESDAGVIWIVTRLSKQSEWNAAMLATMSASWPYEACGGPE